MDQTDLAQKLIPLGFLIFGGGLVFSLLISIMQLLGTKVKDESQLGKSILSIFKWPLIFMVLLLLFVFLLVVPNS